MAKTSRGGFGKLSKKKIEKALAEQRKLWDGRTKNYEQHQQNK